ncbi:hypothetical protein PENTCL1PPCAC_9160, partial [Pristionchus entomophagus]
ATSCFDIYRQVVESCCTSPRCPDAAALSPPSPSPMDLRSSPSPPPSCWTRAPVSLATVRVDPDTFVETGHGED